MRKLSQQTVVITGASSGIGRCAVHEIACHGANVVLAARSESTLHDVAGEVERLGGRALVVPTDVGDPSSIQHLADQAVARFGRVDSWVNNAGQAVYATIDATDLSEFEHILRVNVLGVIAGSKAALAIMRKQPEGGTIINVGSVLSYFSVPFLSAYSASKAAVKSFTEGLRRELLRDNSPIRTCLILPGATNTPFFAHARSKLGVQAKPMPPVYEPETVAQAIAFACESPRSEVTVGAAGKAFEVLERLSPDAFDAMLTTGDMAAQSQMSDKPFDGRDNLEGPRPEKNAVHGEWGPAIPASPYTSIVEQRPILTAVLSTAALAGLCLLIREATKA